MAKLANTFEITESNKILVDGEEFPWFVSADDPIEVVRAEPGHICSVNFSILVESVDIKRVRGNPDGTV